MITALAFTSALTAATFDFMSDGRRVRTFQPRVASRGDSRPKMQAHGRHAQPAVLFGHLDIHAEGIFVGEQSTIVASRAALVAALQDGITSDPPIAAPVAGTLFVRFAGWAERAFVDVRVDELDAPLEHRPFGLMTWMAQFSADQPWLVGEDTDAVYRV